MRRFPVSKPQKHARLTARRGDVGGGAGASRWRRVRAMRSTAPRRRLMQARRISRKSIAAPARQMPSLNRKEPRRSGRSCGCAIVGTGAAGLARR